MMKYFTLLSMLCLSISMTAQAWEQLADIPFDGRHHAITFSFNGKGYALTGTTETEDYSREFWEYDPFSDTWLQLDDYPGLGRTLGIGDEWEGKFYFGFGESSFLQPSLRLFRDLWVFDPVDTSFTQLPSCPCEGRGHPAFIAHNGKIFVGGGSGRTEDLRDWWIYDIESQEWTQGPDIPGGRRHHPFQFGIGDYVYVGGGHDVNWSRYDPVDNTWTGIDNLPEGRVAGTQFSYNGKGYVLSGHDIDHRDVPVSDIFMEYDPELDEWIKLAPHPGTTRWVPGSFIIDGYVYMFGGTERFPPTGVWAKTAYRYPLEEVMVSTTTVSAPSALSVYPNPGEDVVQLQLEGLMAQPHEAVIYDLLGQEIHRSTLSAPQLRIDFLTPGIYSLKVFNGHKEVGSTLLLKQ